MGAADHSEVGEGRGVDRSHNRDTLSSEAMSEMLRDLHDAMLALDERLGALEASHAGASEDTHKLARGVADMGDALARRVRAIEQGRRDPPAILIRREVATPPPIGARRPRPQNRLAWAVAAVLILVIALAAFWLMNFKSLERGAPAAAPNPIAAAPAVTPAPAPAMAVTTPTIPPPAPRTATHAVAQHRSPSWRRASTHAPPESNSTNTPTGFGHYGPSPSAPAPAPAPAAVPTPS